MKNTYQLHKLIHKLTKSEKRAVSLYMQRYNSVKNQKSKSLFDLISKMKIFDEGKLLSVSTKKTLTYDLHRLHKSLIDALSAFHFKSDSDSPGEIINCIELGFKYELSDLIKDSLKRGYAIADKTGNIGFRLHLSYYEQKYEKFDKSNRNFSALLDIYKSDINIAKQFIEKTHYKQLWGEVLIWYRNNRNKTTPEVLTFSNEALYYLFFENDEINFELEQGNYYFLGRAMYFEVYKDSKRDIENDEKNLVLLLKNIDKIELNRISIVYFNLIRSYLGILDFECAEEKLKGFKDFLENISDNEQSKSGINFIYLYALVIFNHVKGNSKEIIEKEYEIKQLIAENKLRANNYAGSDKIESFYLVITFAFLRQKEYAKCLEWILNAKNETNTETLLMEYKFLEFFCHFELGNKRILNSLLNSIDYFLEIKENDPAYNELYRIAKALKNDQSFDLNFEETNGNINHPFSFIRVLLPYLTEKQKSTSIKKVVEHT